MKGKKSLKSKLLETLERVGKIEEGGLEEEDEAFLDSMKNAKIENNSKKNSKVEKACIKGVCFENEGFYIDGAELLVESEEKLPISKKDLDILNDETIVKNSENQPENVQKNEEILENKTIKEKPNSNNNPEIFKSADFTEENENLIQKLNERIQKIAQPPNENPKTKAFKPKKISNPPPCDVFLDFCRKNYLKTMKNPEFSDNTVQNNATSEKDIDNPTLPLQTSPEDAQTIKTLRKELKLKKKLIKSLISPPPVALDPSNLIKSVLFPEFFQELESIPLNSPASPTHRLPKSLLLKAEAFLKQIQGILIEKTLKIDPMLLSELKMFVYSTKGRKNRTEIIKESTIGSIKEEAKEGAKVDAIEDQKKEEVTEEDSRQTQHIINEGKKEEDDRPTEHKRNESTKEKETRLTEPKRNGGVTKDRHTQPKRNNVNGGAKEEDSRHIEYRKAFAFLKKCVYGISAKKLKELNKREKIRWTAWIGVVAILAQFNEEMRVNLRKLEEKDEWLERFLEKHAKNLVWLKSLPGDIENKQNFSG